MKQKQLPPRLRQYSTPPPPGGQRTVEEIRAALQTEDERLNDLIRQCERQRRGFNPKDFQREEFTDRREELAQHIHSTLQLNKHRARQTKPSRCLGPLWYRLSNDRRVTRLAWDLAGYARTYEHDSAVALALHPRRRQVGKPSHFSDEETKDLLRGCINVYTSHTGKIPRAGHAAYAGEFQALVRAVLAAVGHQGATAARALARAISRAKASRR